MRKQATNSLTPNFAQMEKDFYEKNNLWTQAKTSEELKAIIDDTRRKLLHTIMSANIEKTSMDRKLSALQAELNVFELDVLELSNNAELKLRAKDILTKILTN